MIDTVKYRLMLDKVNPKYVGAVFPINECPVPLTGNAVKNHLQDCKSVLVCAATLGEEFDRLLRQVQLVDMAGAVVLDTMAGGRIQRFCNIKDGEILAGIGCGETSQSAESCENSRNKTCYTTRFSPGYEDFPLSVNSNIIAVLKASTKIGLYVLESCMMIPQKSITGVTGIY